MDGTMDCSAYQTCPKVIRSLLAELVASQQADGVSPEPTYQLTLPSTLCGSNARASVWNALREAIEILNEPEVRLENCVDWISTF
jgi:hypothetical protein